MGIKKFRKDKFFYGYKAEMVFHQCFPNAQKLVNQADFQLGDYFIEIGRSRILEMKTIVYFRKLFYNILKEHHKELKEMDSKELFEYLKRQPNDTFKVTPDKFIFVYFTKALKNYTLFDYNDVLMGEFNRFKGGEPHIIVKGNGLHKVTTLFDKVSERIGYTNEGERVDLGGFGVEFEENQFRNKK